MLDFLGLFIEMFSFAESVSFVWLYIFSKSYREKLRIKWNEKKVGIEWESRAILIIEIVFSILFNALIIFGIVYLVFLFINY
jgi:hypothetical protein